MSVVLTLQLIQSRSVNAHAEELRDKFVLHEGKKQLKIKAFGDRHHFDYAWMADKFSDMLRDNASVLY
jgi:hypothetical protein